MDKYTKIVESYDSSQYQSNYILKKELEDPSIHCSSSNFSNSRELDNAIIDQNVPLLSKYNFNKDNYFDIMMDADDSHSVSHIIEKYNNSIKNPYTLECGHKTQDYPLSSKNAFISS